MGAPISEYAEKHFTFGDVPQEAPPAGEIWVISDQDGVCAVDFRCPCGCGADCYTPVTDATKGQPKTARHWLFSRGPNGVTLSPSIRYLGGCKAHFFITDGKASLCGDSGN